MDNRTASSPPPPSPLPLPLKAATRRALPWLVAVGFFMQSLDATILNTTLPRMADDMGESPLRMQSVVIAYMLTVALLIPASGWLADRWGTRRLYFGAIAVFAGGSLLCALSPTLPWLIGARVVQGIGGAFLLPVGRLAILRAFPKAELLKVMAFITVPGLVGPLLGPPLGGWLVEVASWHWVFLINLPVGLVGCAVTWRFMPELRGVGTRFDWPGFVLFSLGLVMVSLGLQGLGERAFSVAASLLLLVAGLATMTGYWLHAVRTVDSPAPPLFSPALFRIRSFSIGVLGNLFSRLGSGAMPFLVPLFLQVGLGYAPVQAGLSMLPIVIGAMASKTIEVPLIDRFGYRAVLVANTLALAAMIAGFAVVHRDTPRLVILAQLAVFGIFNSLQFTAMNTLSLGDLDPPRASSGNSLLSVVMQLSMSLGVAAAGALLAAFGEAQAVRGSVATDVPALLHTFHATFACVGALSALAACIFFQLGRVEAATAAVKPAAVVEDA